MRFVLPAFAKLNLSLRVTGRRPDGYHDLLSIFLRIPSGEALRVEALPAGAEDRVEVRGMDLRLTGENVVARALRLAREAGAQVPPFRVEILKSLFPGAGLGGGSGNAAALLQWLASKDASGPWEEVARRTGADVPFLFSGAPMALVAGTGDHLEPLAPPRLSGVIAFPSWEVGTENAYAALDAALDGGYPKDEGSARREAEGILSALRANGRPGLLPNDFALPLVEAHGQYRELFALFEGAGALAWGITGSGGAAFALTCGGELDLEWPSWVRQVLYLPPLP